MVVALGETLTVVEGAVPLNAVPSDNVPLIVPAPVNAKVKVALPPLQIAVVPLIATVGRALTVTSALPVKSAAIDAHVPSVAVETV